MLELNLNIESLQLYLSGAPLSHYRLLKKRYELQDFGNARINLITEINREKKERILETFDSPIVFLYDKRNKKEAVCIKRETLSQIIYAIYDYNPKTDLVK